MVSRRKFISVLFFSCLLLAGVKAQTPVSRAYKVQAGFLYQFTQFVEWPADLFSSPSAPFVIGIVGSDPFGAYLNKLLAGKRANGRPIRVQRFTNSEEIESCHILFINKHVASSVLAECVSRSVLTVSNDPAFVNNGGMVRFFAEQNKTRFEINLPLAKDARLEISSKLLRLARVIEK